MRPIGSTPNDPSRCSHRRVSVDTQPSLQPQPLLARGALEEAKSFLTLRILKVKNEGSSFGGREEENVSGVAATGIFSQELPSPCSHSHIPPVPGPSGSATTGRAARSVCAGTWRPRDTVACVARENCGLWRLRETATCCPIASRSSAPEGDNPGWKDLPGLTRDASAPKGRTLGWKDLPGLTRGAPAPEGDSPGWKDLPGMTWDASAPEGRNPGWKDLPGLTRGASAPECDPRQSASASIRNRVSSMISPRVEAACGARGRQPRSGPAQVACAGTRSPRETAVICPSAVV